MSKKTLAVFSILMFIIGLVPVYFAHFYPGLSGKLHIDPAKGNTLHIEEYDLDIYGIDRDGVTYFCLPAFINLIDIDMTESPLKIYLEDGSVLDKALVGKLQRVNVETSEGNLVPWTVAFMRSANLNSVFLDLEGAGVSDIDHNLYRPVNVEVYSPMGALSFTDEDAYIKGRGNATWKTEYFEPEKKPYEIKFSESVRIGELYPKKKWTLLANAYEGTDILNKMILDTARDMDMRYVTDSEWIDLYANGIYLGNYLVCSEPDEALSSVIDDGGWLIEKNDTYYDIKPYGFTTSHDAFTLRSPDMPSDALISAVSEQISDTDKALRRDPASFDELVDLDSFVRWFILEELFYNEDALVTSCYFYSTGKDGILFAGPPWDFDNTCGEGGKRFLDPEGSILNEPENRNPIDWYNILYGNPVFRARLSELFSEYAPIFCGLVDGGIDEYYRRTEASVRMDRAIYGTNGYGQDYTVPGYYKSVMNNFRYTKYYLSERLSYLSDKWDYSGHMPSVETSDGSYHTLTFKYSDSVNRQITIMDGDLLKDSDIPQYDPTIYSGWIYEENGLDISFFIPVYEDCSFVLEEIQEEDT